LNLRFAGQYYDKETNLHYNYFRDYDPSIGRYVSSDPIGLAGGLNTYAYVENNPLRFVDPMGLTGAIPIPIPIPRPIPIPAPVPYPIDPILPIPMPIPDESLPDKPSSPARGCRFVREVHYGGPCKTCWYECPGYKAPVTFPQAAGKSCPGITPAGLVDTSQIDPKCRQQPQACK
jgi:RHS repeat-associated protein